MDLAKKHLFIAAKYWIYFATFSAFFILNEANAIVIRHDIPDQHYRDLAKTYTASLAYMDRCAATVISQNTLITAGHCVSINNKYPIQITHLGIKYPVEEIIMPPNTEQFSDTDIALLKLKWPLRNAKPVAVYGQKDELGQKIYIIGKGLTGNGISGEKVKDGLERAASNVISSVDKNWLNFTFDKPPKATELEGVSGSEDSGGPAFMITDQGLALVGVSCCQMPIVIQGEGERQGGYLSTEHYSRLSPHKLWIMEQVNRKVVRKSFNSQIIDALELSRFETAKQLIISNKQWLNDPALVSEILTHSFYRSNELSYFLLTNFPQLHVHKLRGLPLTVYAYLQGNSAIFSLLIKLGVAMDYSGFKGQQLPSLITWQYFNNDYEQQLSLLLTQGFDINKADERGDTALHMAVYLGRINRVLTLLKLGAEIDKVDAKGNSALIDATRKGNTAIVKLLIREGADTSITNHDLKNAKMIAMESGFTNLAKYFIVESNI